MMRFNLTISHVPGKLIIIADTLSCAPVESPSNSDHELTIQPQAFVSLVLQCLPVSEQRIQQIKESQQRDGGFVLMMSYCHS